MLAARVLWLAVCGVLCVLLGCANLTSIERRTSLPSAKDGKPGKAVHLDIKQRVLLSKDGIVCAEPSPDALSAFASAAGAGGGIAGRGSAAAAYALSEAAANVGLRTQSITLLRDTQYRICEAYFNGHLGWAEVVALLARSLDLTAAVVAIEQLTGAVIAKQAALEGAAGSSSAALIANAESLARITELEQQYNRERFHQEEATRTYHGGA